MIPLKIADLKFNFPTSWEDITVEQYFRIADNKVLSNEDTSRNPFVEIVSILSGIPYEKWFHVNDQDVELKVIPYMAFLKDKLDLDKLPRPKEFRIGDKKYKLPENLGFKTWGQKIVMEDKLDPILKNGGDLSVLTPCVLAVYFQPEITGGAFFQEKAEELIPQINQCKIVDAYPVAAFFLRSLLDLKKEISPNLNSNLIKTKWLRDSINYLYSVFGLRSMPSLREMSFGMKKSFVSNTKQSSRN